MMKNKKRILVTACGGAPAINFTRSLRVSKDDFFLLGADANPYLIHRGEVDERAICPRADEPDYIHYLNFLIEKYDIEFIHAQPDIEVGVISENRDRLKCRTFLPDQRSVSILRNKFLSYSEWEKAGIKVPKTLLLNNTADLEKAFECFGNNIWIREIEGAAGKGSLSSPTFKEALESIETKSGWGRFTAAEKLSKRTVTWMSIYYHGELVVAQGRERLYWEVANRTQSGVTGITGAGKTVSDPLVDEISVKCIAAVDSRPHGIFSVDMTYDNSGIPNPTEINIGKFFTTHYFFTKAGINFPEIYVKLAFGEDVGFRNKVNPLKQGLHWIRGMDIEPVLIEEEKIKALEKTFSESRKKKYIK